jgi:hypothetical protein
MATIIQSPIPTSVIQRRPDRPYRSAPTTRHRSRHHTAITARPIAAGKVNRVCCLYSQVALRPAISWPTQQRLPLLGVCTHRGY